MADSIRDGEEDELVPTIAIQPSNLQFICDEVMSILIFIASMVGYAVLDGIPKTMFLVFLLVSAAWLLCRYLSFARVKFVITPEQVIFLHGMFMQVTDYMELYRIVDYQEHRGLLQQLFGLKTLILFSGDASLPELDIIGLGSDVDIVSQIRYRVELNKHKRHIYEITNHY